MHRLCLAGGAENERPRAEESADFQSILLGLAAALPRSGARPDALPGAPNGNANSNFFDDGDGSSEPNAGPTPEAAPSEGIPALSLWAPLESSAVADAAAPSLGRDGADPAAQVPSANRPNPPLQPAWQLAGDLRPAAKPAPESAKHPSLPVDPPAPQTIANEALHAQDGQPGANSAGAFGALRDSAISREGARLRPVGDDSPQKAQSAPTNAPHPAGFEAMFAALKDAAAARALHIPAATDAMDRANLNAVMDEAQALLEAMKSQVSIRPARGEATIRLDPPSMGEVEIEIHMDRGDRIKAVVRTESPHAMDLLSRHSDHLRSALSEIGIALDDFDFSPETPGGQDGAPDSSSRFGDGSPDRGSQDGYRSYAGQEGHESPSVEPVRVVDAKLVSLGRIDTHA